MTSASACSAVIGDNEIEHLPGAVLPQQGAVQQCQKQTTIMSQYFKLRDALLDDTWVGAPNR
jgi:hypothetical protein